MDYHAELNFDVRKITDYEQVRDRIICELRNMEKNVQYLKDKPYIQLEDMAVTYHVFLGENMEEGSFIPIKQDIFQNYGIGIKELHETAMKNTTRLFPPIIRSMWEHMMPDDMKEEEPEQGVKMYVLTNNMNMKGAVSILDPEVMEEAGERVGGDFFVIPSSINELILLKREEGMNYHVLEAMLEEANAAQLAENEILSEHVYKVDLKEHSLVRCGQAEQKIQKESRRKEQKTLKNQSTKPKRVPQVRGPKL